MSTEASSASEERCSHAPDTEGPSLIVGRYHGLNTFGSGCAGGQRPSLASDRERAIPNYQFHDPLHFYASCFREGEETLSFIGLRRGLHGITCDHVMPLTIVQQA